MTFLIIIFCILLLVLIIAWGKVNAFLSFLVVSVVAAFLVGMPLEKISGSIQKGIGDTLGSLIIVVILGAMLGKLVAISGAVTKISTALMKMFGREYIQWALMVTGFIVGIPLFYNVGFILFVPLIFSVAYEFKLPSVYIGMPMLAALSVTHGFLPPHPSPAALVSQFHANMGLTLLYGLIIAVPTIIIAGPVFATTLKNIRSEPLDIFRPAVMDQKDLPGTFNSYATALLPVMLLIVSVVLSYTVSETSAFHPAVVFFGDPSIVMLISISIATFSLGIKQGKSMKQVMAIYADAISDVSVIVLIVGGAGALKQVFADSGVSGEIAASLLTLNIHPLVLGWLIACVIRVCIGSATIAGLTTAGLIAPVITQANVDANLMVLSIGAGSLMFSHVNDAGFWLYKEYFNLSVKDTIRSWSMMETIVAILGLAGVMLINLCIH